MWRVTSRNRVLNKWVKEREIQIEDEYKDKALEIEKKDFYAMIIAAFIVIGPLVFLAMMIISLMYLFFNLWIM